MDSKKIFLTFFLFFLVALIPANAQPLRVMTFNIRLDARGDGENVWENRRANLVSMIRFHKADVVGLQEAQKHQLEYIVQSLPEYGWFGVGRDDGKDTGEFAAILYRKSRFDTLKTATFWCSQTPEKPGKGWDAAYQRVTTYGMFKDKLTKKKFYLFNTHLDNEGAVARLESARLIKHKMQQLCGTLPVILTGDFNSTPDSDPYKAITTSDKGGFALFDTQLKSQTKHHGPKGSFTGFDLNARPLEPIDFIFVTGGITVYSHGTLSDSFDGYLPSDHYPVLSEIGL